MSTIAAVLESTIADTNTRTPRNTEDEHPSYLAPPAQEEGQTDDQAEKQRQLHALAEYQKTINEETA